MGQVPEPQCDPAEVLEAAVDGFGGAVAGAWAVEEREHVGRASAEGPAQAGEFDEFLRDPGTDRVDHTFEQELSQLLVGLPIRDDEALVDAPSGVDLGVSLVGEQPFETGDLPVGEEVDTGEQGAAGAVERIPGAAPMPAGVLLDPLPAARERFAGKTHDVERVHHGGGVVEFLDRGGLVAGESVHRDDLDPVAPGVGAGGEPGLEHLFRAALDHVQQPRRAGTVSGRGEVDDHGHVLRAAAGVAPAVLVNPDHTHTIEASRIRDQDALSFGQHGVVGGVPRDVETDRDPRHAQVLDHKSFQTPTQRGPRQLRTRLGCGTDVLAPHPPALDAPIAPQPHV